MPAVKCLPVEEMTITRARALSLMSFTIFGNSFQNGRGIALKASGRLRTMWAMLFSMLTAKQDSDMGGASLARP